MTKSKNLHPFHFTYIFLLYAVVKLKAYYSVVLVYVHSYFCIANEWFRTSSFRDNWHHADERLL